MMNGLNRGALLGLATGWLTIAGCSLLSPQPDPSRFYTLSALPEALAHENVASPQNPTVIYGLGPITLPAYLDRNAIAIRVSPTEIAYSWRDFWAEPLQANVRRVLLENISTLLETDRFVLYPWLPNSGVDYQVAVDVLRCEADINGSVQLAARWTISDVRNGGVLVVRESNLTRSSSGNDTAAAITALSGGLGGLSREIATALRGLPAPEPAQPKRSKRT